LAFNLYCKIPFGKIHIHNPEIIALANTLKRSPSAVSWKLANFARLDPFLQKRQISGAPHGGKLDVEIWREFSGNWERLAFESESLLAERTHKPIEEVADIETTDLPKEGLEREAKVKTRVNQNFFRLTVLAAYGFKCCITGLPIPELLNASHIVPWSVDKTNRVNPCNGLCLNVIHDRAFDRGLITVTADYKIKISPLVKAYSGNDVIQALFFKYEGANILLPSRFQPNIEFLDFHNRTVFKQ